VSAGRFPILDAARHAPIAARAGGRRVYYLRRDGAEVLTHDVAPWEKILGYCDPGGAYTVGNPPPEATS
jgi:hypothetical protein